jgi:hypothetical protein
MRGGPTKPSATSSHTQLEAGAWPNVKPSFVLSPFSRVRVAAGFAEVVGDRLLAERALAGSSAAQASSKRLRLSVQKSMTSRPDDVAVLGRHVGDVEPRSGRTCWIELRFGNHHDVSADPPPGLPSRRGEGLPTLQNPERQFANGGTVAWRGNHGDGVEPRWCHLDVS